MREDVSPLRQFGILAALFLCLTSTHCFLFGGVKQTGRVKSYEPGRVITQKGFYNVGELPPDWKRMKVGSYRTVAFYNDALKSSIETDAFCDSSYDDASLKVLTTHLFFNIQDRQIKWEKSFMLDQRGALRSMAQGKVDGVPIVLDTVVIKKDECLFDFALVSEPGHYAKAALDFETFFKGFRFQGNL